MNRVVNGRQKKALWLKELTDHVIARRRYDPRESHVSSVYDGGL